MSTLAADEETLLSLPYAVGEIVVFLGYKAEFEPIFRRGQHLVVAAIGDDGSLKCFACSKTGRPLSPQGDTVFRNEVLRLPTVERVKLPYPYSQLPEMLRAGRLEGASLAG